MDNLNLDLSRTRKKRITIDGDENRVLELNTSDFGIITRLESIYSELNTLGDTILEFVEAEAKADDTDDLSQIHRYSEKFKEVDGKMRKLLDDLFQSNVSDICCPVGTGSMYDMFDGEQRWEIILEQILNLYSDSIRAESEKTKNAVKSHTSRYTQNRAERRAKKK